MRMAIPKKSFWRRLPRLVGPDEKVLPTSRTVILSLIFFVLYLTVGGAITRYSISANQYIGFGIGAAFLLLILVMLIYDFSCKGLSYKRNLSNTVITVFLTIIILPLLYYLHWYPNMIHQTLQFSQDTLDSARFPSVAVLQQQNWSSQGNLSVVDSQPKCFINWLEGNSIVPCDASPPGAGPCNCTDSWSQEIEILNWGGQSYRYLNMRASEAMGCISPGTQMILQAFYWYNSTQAYVDSDWFLNPSLWIAIYDSTLSLVEALEQNYTRMILVDANSMITVNLGLSYRQNPGANPAYDYDLMLSPVPAMSLVCDRGSKSNPASGPCHLSLFLQFPTFQRRVSLEQYTMYWTDVVAAAGSYFSFVQLLSWIISGMAFQT